MGGMPINSDELSLKQTVKWSRIWHGEVGENGEDGDYTFKNSYSALIDHLKRDLQIELNTPIVKITYPTAAPSATGTAGTAGRKGAGGGKGEQPYVILTAKDGTEYRAKTVVVTSSPHVMNSKMVAFSPELPAEVQDAFQCMRMNNVIKVFMKFKTRCWPENLHGMIMQDDDFLLPEVWFRNVEDEVEPGEPATCYAVGFTTAKYAERVAGLSQEEVLKRSVAQLEKVFSKLEPKHMVGDLTQKPTEKPSDLPKASEVYLGGMFWDWRPQHHPYIGGGYASAKAGKPITYGQVLEKPCGTSMYFAGEATNSRAAATAHAALETGVRVAKQVADNLKNKK